MYIYKHVYTYINIHVLLCIYIYTQGHLQATITGHLRQHLTNMTVNTAPRVLFFHNMCANQTLGRLQIAGHPQVCSGCIIIGLSTRIVNLG